MFGPRSRTPALDALLEQVESLKRARLAAQAELDAEYERLDAAAEAINDSFGALLDGDAG
jgi:hypothetical protein